MKILYFTPYFLPLPEAAAVRSYWFVQTLKEAQHDIELITNEQLRCKLATNKDHALMRLVKENTAGIELFIRIFRSNKDLYVLSSPPFFTVVWGALACILRGSKYILDVRDLYPEVFFETKLIRENSLLGKLAKSVTAFIYRRSHHIISVTHGLINEIKKYGPEHVHLMMNGYDSSIFFRGNKTEKFPDFTLVFHGNLGKVQNIETLLKLSDALSPYPEIKIKVAGSGSKAPLIEAAKKSNIEFLGSVPYNDIPKLLRKCHVGLSFRTDDKIGREAFPVKVFEYIGSGLPIILAPKGEAGDLVEKEGFGKQFENNEISLMVTAILKMKESDLEMKIDQNLSRQLSSKKILRLLS